MLGFAPAMRGQDAATEERLNKLSGRIDDVLAAQESMRKQLSELAREIQSVREMASKPPGNFASEEDLVRLKKAIEEVDRKRSNDAEEVQKQLLKIRELVLKMPVAPPPSPGGSKRSSKEKDTGGTTDKPTSDKPPTGDDTGIPYTIQAGDSLSLIVQGCKAKNIKTSVDRILKANPGLDEKKLKVGQKIFIPATPPS
jgi:LysM repeat protein